MKSIILCLVATLLLTSCKSEIDKDREIIKDYYQTVLKDPASYQEHSLKLIEKKKEYNKIYELDYGAKNGFGGMVRERVKIEVLGEKVFSVDDNLVFYKQR